MNRIISDELGACNNPHLFNDRATIDDAYDYDRDSLVGVWDEQIARGNRTNFLTGLKLITVPPAAAFSAATLEDFRAAARAFDEVHAEDNQGGFGVARMDDTPDDDRFEFIGDTARVYGWTGSELDLLYEAIAFERIKAHRTTDGDTRDDASHTLGDELYLYGWDE